MFRFKQFTIEDELCGMKVGTDGVLLGAWAPADDSSRVLDVGTGSGLIALMLAQRCPKAKITAIDIDPSAAQQAAKNFATSPWSERLTAGHCSLQAFASTPENNHAYQLIVSNPPYFADSLKNPDAGRKTARHTDSLSFAELIDGCCRLLTDDGTLAFILPADEEAQLLGLAAQHKLIPYHITRVRTRTGKPVKRVMIAWSFKEKDCLTEELELIDASGTPRSAAYQNLCKEFYL